MTLARWPGDLTAPNRDGYGLDYGEARRRTRSDAGPVRTSRRLSLVADTLSLVFDWTRAELARFDRWYKDEIKLGSLPFIMPNWHTNGWALLLPDGTTLLTPAGAPVLVTANWLCIIADGLPRPAPIGNRFRLPLAISVLP